MKKISDKTAMRRALALVRIFDWPTVAQIDRNMRLEIADMATAIMRELRDMGFEVVRKS